MKRAISAVLVFGVCIVTVLSLTGCGIFGILDSIVDAMQAEDGPGKTRDRAEALRIEYSETVMECFKTGDIERLKGVFCTKTQDIPDIDEQIGQVFDFIEGNITEYTVSPEMKGEGMGWDYGVVNLYEGYGDIYKVKTDAGKWYEISFHMYYVVRNEDRKGITYIVLRDTQNTNDYSANPECYEDDTYFRIGYEWNENYGCDAGCLAYDAIKAISDGDIAALKETFCAQTLEDSEIDAQMQAAFDFFDGKAVFGEPQNNSEIIYDGDHDFHIESVKDDVVLENGEEAVVFVDVYTVNIETDAGKIYEMKWAAYLKNEKEPDCTGMIYFTLIDGANRCQVGEKPQKH